MEIPTASMPSSVWMRARLTRNIGTAALYLSVLAVLGAGLLAHNLVARSNASVELASHAAAGVTQLERLHRTLVQSESMGRAFLVSGDAQFSDAYDIMLARVDDQLHQMKVSGRLDARQQAQLAELEHYVDRRFDYLSEQIASRALGFEEMRRASKRIGSAEMTEISAVIEEMKSAEAALLADRTATTARLNERLESGLVAVLALWTAIMGTFFWYMSRMWKRCQQAEAVAIHLAHHDPLTGLPNRRLLEDRLAMGIARASREHETLAVLAVDLDGFKRVNDTYGHDAGDEVLRQVAERLRGLLRKGDTVARLGGDEFVVALSQVENAGYSAAVAARIIESLCASYSVKGHWTTVGTSVGIAHYPLHAGNIDELLKRADTALYRAKSSGTCAYAWATV